MIKHSFIFSALLFLIISCDSKNDSSDILRPDSIVEFSFDEHSPSEIISVDFDSLFDDYEPVVLQHGGDNDNIIGSVNNILLNKDTLYIIDRSQAKSVMMYSISGKFLGKIGNIGKGPGEYLAIKHVRLNKKKRRLELHDNFQGKLVFFDLSGNYLHEKRIFASADFIYSEQYNKYYFYTIFSPVNGKHRYRLIITDDDFEFISGHFPYDKSQDLSFLIRLKNNFYETGDGKIYFTEVFGNEIYEIIDTAVVQTHSLAFRDQPDDGYIDTQLTPRINKMEEAQEKFDHLSGHFIIDNKFNQLNYIDIPSNIIYHVSIVNGHTTCYNSIKHDDNFQLLGFNFYDPQTNTLTFSYNLSPHHQILAGSKLSRALEKLDSQAVNPILIRCKLKK